MAKLILTQTPRWYLPVAILALLWNLVGCLAYLSDVMMTPEDIAQLSAELQDIYATRTTWLVAATAIAVWAGATGCVGLIWRKRWATPLLIASLAGLIVQDFGLFVLTDAGARAGSVPLQGMVLLIGIGLVMLARKASAQQWIT